MGLTDLFEKVIKENDRADQAAQTNTGIVGAAATAHAVNPDEYTANRNDAVSKGYPASFAMPPKDNVDPQKMQDTLKIFSQLQGKVKGFVADPSNDYHNAKIAQDDTENLSTLERIYQEYGKKPVVSTIAEMRHALNYFVGLPFASIAGPKSVDVIGKKLDALEQTMKENEPLPDTSMGGRFVQGLIKLVLQLPMGEAMIPSLMAQTSAAKATDLVNEGVGDKTTVGLSTLEGLTTGLMALLAPGGKVEAKTFSKKGMLELLKDVSKGSASFLGLGAGERAVEKGTLLATGNEEAAKKVDILSPEGAAQDVAMATVFTLLHRYQAVKQKTLLEQYKNSIVRERDPEAFKKFVGSMAGDQRVTVPVDIVDEYLAKAGKKPEDLYDPTAYYEAKATGEKAELTQEDMAMFADHVTDDHLNKMSVPGLPSPDELPGKAKDTEESKGTDVGENKVAEDTVEAKRQEDEATAKEASTAIDKIKEHAKAEGTVLHSVEQVDEDKVLDWKNKEDQGMLAEHGISEEEYNNAIKNGERFRVVGQHYLSNSESGQVGSNIRLFRGHTAEDVYHEYSHAIDAQGKLAGWGGTKEQRAKYLAKVFLGNDGVITDSDWSLAKNYIAFYPEQIKSVDNRGTFDSKNPDILASIHREKDDIPKDIPADKGAKGPSESKNTFRDSKAFKAAQKLLTPGWEIGKAIKEGVQSLVLPTAISPEHYDRGVEVGKALGAMHRNQEVMGAEMDPLGREFTKLGVYNEKTSLTANPGMKFTSKMSTGEGMTPKMRKIAETITKYFDDRLEQLEAAGAPIEKVRENYFPGMWTTESRKAFNQSMGGYLEAHPELKDLDVNDWSAEDKKAVSDRTGLLLKGGKGSDKDQLSYLTRRPLKGKEGFRKGKVFDDVMTAVQFGLTPVSTNPIDIVRLKLSEMDRSIMANSLLQEWREKGTEKFLRVGQQVPEGWVKVDDKYGTVYGPKDMAGKDENGKDIYIGRPIIGNRIVTKAAADILNNYLSSSLYNSRALGTIYKGYMATANLLNQSQLGIGSFFHVGFTEAEVTISAGANLIKDIYGAAAKGNRTWGDVARSAMDVPKAFITTPMEGNKILEAYRNPDAPLDQKVMNIAKAAELGGGGFKMEFGMKTEQYEKMIQDWYSGKRVQSALRSPVAVIELMAKPILEYIVPRQKAGVFGHLAQRIMDMNPGKSLEELAPEFRQAWNRVDARLGQVRYDRLYMDNVTKNVVQGLVRAPGWSGGTIAEIGGALKDTAKFIKEWTSTGKLPKDVPDRVAYTLSLMTTTVAVNGLLTYLFTGEKPEGTDFWAFRTGGSDEYGNPERFVLPTYQKDIWAYSQDWEHTLTGKAHPVIGIMADLIKNKDYYGVKIANEDDGVILKQIERGEYVLKQFVPFWMRGAAKESERGGGLLETLQNEPQKLLAPQIGIMPATSSYTRTKAEKQLSEYMKEQVPSGGRTQEEADKSKLRGEIIRAKRMNNSLSDDQMEAYNAMTDRQRSEVEKDASLTPLQASFRRLADPNLDKSLHIWSMASDEEREQIHELYTHKINLFFMNHPGLNQEEINKVNERIDKAEDRDL